MTLMLSRLLLPVVAGSLFAAQASASNLYSPTSWSSLASDRIAHVAGDPITILVYENSSASDTASSNSRKSASLAGSLALGSLSKSGSGSYSGGSDSAGSIGRSGRMVAQISATVDSVYPNGDLQIVGQQELHISGEKTHIKVRGRVRVADVSASNTVLSSRLADAMIDYDGTGFVSRAAKPGIVIRILNWLGVL